MKKTIAKIMAAAVALSTVVAPNVNASMSVSDGGVFDYLTIDQGEESGTSYFSLLRADTDTVNTQANALTTKFSVERNDAGHIKYVTTDLTLNGGAMALGGNVVYYDVSEKKFVVVANSTAAVTATEVSKASDVNNKSLEDMGVSGNDTDGYTYDGKSYKTVELVAAAVIKDLKKSSYVTSNAEVTNLSDSVKGFEYSNSATTISGDSKYKDVKAIGATMFSGIWFDDDTDALGFTVGNPSDQNDALITAALNDVDPIALKVGFTFDEDITWVDTTLGVQKVGTKYVWIQLGGDLGTNYDGYVLLKKDNNQYEKIRVNYTLDSNNYATIDSANTSLLKLDTAKGGRLLLDYVYKKGVAYEGTVGNTNRDKASSTKTTNAFKIRRIGSRIFKDCKFQQISGWGDDGAKYIRTINNGAFRSCKQLKKVNLDTDKKIRKINAKAFYKCKKLATVKLDGRNLKQIGSNAFKDCKSNITFKIKGNASQVKKAWAKIKKQAPKKAKYSKI